jgi:hypothetical protein
MRFNVERNMTPLLVEPFTRAMLLPPEDQDALAMILLAEMDSERGWDQLFAQSQNQLEKLAEEALAEFQEGKTQPFDEDL